MSPHPKIVKATSPHGLRAPALMMASKALPAGDYFVNDKAVIVHNAEPNAKWLKAPRRRASKAGPQRDLYLGKDLTLDPELARLVRFAHGRTVRWVASSKVKSELKNETIAFRAALAFKGYALVAIIAPVRWT